MDKIDILDSKVKEWLDNRYCCIETNIGNFSDWKFLNKETIHPKKFTKQIAFNVIPHIDVFADDGYTKEELKMVNETKKILDNKIKLTATCVRVPVLVSHSESVNIQFEKSFSLDQT